MQFTKVIKFEDGTSIPKKDFISFINEKLDINDIITFKDHKKI